MKRWNHGGECAVRNVEQQGDKYEDVAPAGRGDERRRRLSAFIEFEKMAWFTKKWVLRGAFRFMGQFMA